MTVLYCNYRKSCSNASGWIPVKASGEHDLFKSPVYLQHVSKYRKTVQAAVRYTLSRVRHITSLFQYGESIYSFGDIVSTDDAILVRMEGAVMEIFIFPGKRVLAETFYRSVDKLPIDQIRSQAKPVMKEKYSRQLDCYQGQQMTFMGV